jgi:hypothetical protein
MQVQYKTDIEKIIYIFHRAFNKFCCFFGIFFNLLLSVFFARMDHMPIFKLLDSPSMAEEEKGAVVFGRQS